MLFSKFSESTTNTKHHWSTFLPGKLIALTSTPLINNVSIQQKASIIFFTNFGWHFEKFSLGIILLSVEEENMGFL